MNALVDIVIDNVDEDDYGRAEELAKSLLRDPEGWEFYSSGYDPKRKQLEVTLCMFELHSDETW